METTPFESIDYNQCQQAVKQLTDYLSHELSNEEEALVRRHLNECRGCFEKFHFEETLLKTLREKVRQVEPPTELLQRLHALLQHERPLSEG